MIKLLDKSFKYHNSFKTTDIYQISLDESFQTKMMPLYFVLNFFLLSRHHFK